MKIAMIGHKGIPGGSGGVEVVVEELACRMVAAKHEVTVYNRGSRGPESKIKEYRGVRVVTVPTVNTKSLDALVYSLLATLHALFGGYDVLHYHSLGPSAMLFLPRLFGKRVVATVHGLDWQRAKWGGFGRKYLLFGERTIARRACEVIVLNRADQQHFLEAYGRETVLIPNGVEPAEHLAADEITKRFGLSRDGYFLFLARVVPEKGLHVLLRAFKELETDVRLVIAGEQSHTSSYYGEILEQAQGDGRVVFVGFAQGRLKAELFSNCLTYVLPSSIEGMPLSLLEARSYGARCLVSDIAENVEALGDAGYTFAVDDEDALRVQLRRCLREPPPAGDCVGLLNWDEVVTATLAVYEPTPALP